MLDGTPLYKHSCYEGHQCELHNVPESLTFCLKLFCKIKVSGYRENVLPPTSWMSQQRRWDDEEDDMIDD